jgi:hypothetical protein
MSKSPIGIAVIVLAILLSSAAEARVHLGVGPLGVARLAAARLLSLGGWHRAYRHRHGRNPSLASQDIRSAVNSGRGLGNPAARGQVAAAAALVGWHGGRIANGWWRHADGGYGWVGPLFWPFPYHDIHGYTMRGDGTGFWAYGSGDIYAAIFAPYGKDDLASYTMPDPSGRRHRRVPSLQQLCGYDSRDTAGLPVDQIQRAIQPTEAQRAAMDDLANAWRSAAQIIAASCPTQAASTAPARLAAMQERLQAIIKAEATVQPALEKFYGLLDDEQKARLNAPADDRRKMAATSGSRVAQGCEADPSAAFKWPADEIEAALHLDDTQRAALEVLEDTSASAAETLSAECRHDAITPPARLAAANRRLDAMLQAVKLVTDALEDFYATLSDAQKAQFEAIGPKRTA